MLMVIGLVLLNGEGKCLFFMLFRHAVDDSALSTCWFLKVTDCNLVS